MKVKRESYLLFGNTFWVSTLHQLEKQVKHLHKTRGILARTRLPLHADNIYGQKKYHKSINIISQTIVFLSPKKIYSLRISTFKKIDKNITATTQSTTIKTRTYIEKIKL